MHYLFESDFTQPSKTKHTITDQMFLFFVSKVFERFFGIFNPFNWFKNYVHNHIESTLEGLEGPIIGLPPKGIPKFILNLAVKFLKPNTPFGWLVHFIVDFINHVTFANADSRFKKSDDHTKFFHFLLQFQKKVQKRAKADAICLPKVSILKLQQFRTY